MIPQGGRIRRVTLTKLTEPKMATALRSLDVVVVFKFVVDGACFDPTHEVSANQRRIEVVGDSDTAAFGNVGEPTSVVCCCAMAPHKQNGENGFAQMLGRHFGAETHAIAWSGIGVHTCALGTSSTTLSERYPRCIASEPTATGGVRGGDGDASSWVPDLVVLFAGANDMLGGCTAPSRDQFTEGYIALLRAVRASNPRSAVLCVVMEGEAVTAAGGLARANQASAQLFEYISDAVQSYVQQFADDNPPVVKLIKPRPVMSQEAGDFATMEHWSVQGHLKVAQAIAVEVSELLHWECANPLAPLEQIERSGPAPMCCWGRGCALM